MKILFLDIETAPNIGYTWGAYEQDVIRFIENWYILSVGYKWFGSPAKVMALPDFEGYKPEGKDEKLVKFIWELLNEADIVVAQNGDRFDLPKINTRFLNWKLPPPSPYRTIDTLKIARKFDFNSNHLDDLGKDLGVGRKMKHEGFDLWYGCMHGKMDCWKKMKRYNKKDVELLSKVYLTFRPYITNHPNIGTELSCPKCGSGHLNFRGEQITQDFKYRRFQCQECGGWGRILKGKRFTETKNA